jgi:Ran GTPase-activating protein (RanGAP) involved in mRNA processing and transport
LVYSINPKINKILGATMILTLENIPNFVDGHRLCLYNLDLTDADVQTICTFLGEHPEIEITELEINNNQIGDAGALLLAKLNLTLLEASYNAITAVGAGYLALCPTLESLSIVDNLIGPAGTQSLAASTRLRSLNISDNSIGDAGAQHLAANRSLTALDVSNCDILAEGATALRQALINNPTLTQLTFGDNPGFTAAIGQGCEDLLRRNNNLATSSLGLSARCQGVKVSRCQGVKVSR